MRFYFVVGLMLAGFIGGYRATGTYRQLDQFHRRYLEAAPRNTAAEPIEAKPSPDASPADLAG